VVARSHEAEFRLANAPHFVATMIAAFASRGDRDVLGSKDIEDILAVVDGQAVRECYYRSTVSYAGKVESRWSSTGPPTVKW
jgi:hypothetical protein